MALLGNTFLEVVQYCPPFIEKKVVAPVVDPIKEPVIVKSPNPVLNPAPPPEEDISISLTLVVSSNVIPVPAFKVLKLAVLAVLSLKKPEPVPKLAIV